MVSVPSQRRLAVTTRRVALRADLSATARSHSTRSAHEPRLNRTPGDPRATPSTARTHSPLARHRSSACRVQDTTGGGAGGGGGAGACQRR